MTPEVLRSILAAKAAAHAVVLATRLSDGRQLLLPNQAAPEGLREAGDLALRRNESQLVDQEGGAWFLQVHAPPPQLVIVGAVHIAQVLAPMAHSLSFNVIVVDPRRAFAREERFPGVALSHRWPDDAIDTIKPDARTAIVTLTHDPKIDDPALDRALRSDAFFLGALGSRRTHAARLERLAKLGHSPEVLARIRGPVGLALGAISAPEIALSIVAEIVALRRGAALSQR